MKGFRLVGVVAALVGVSCTTAPAVDMTPYRSPTGFAFEVADGTGTYRSSAKYYRVQWCGRDYPGFAMDVGQQKFDEIHRLAEQAGMWSAYAQRVPGCEDIDPARPGQYFHFSDSARSVILDLQQCETAGPIVQPYLDRIRAIIRQESDKHKLRVNYECIAF